MNDADTVKDHVTKFWRAWGEASDRRLEDCFAPWFLTAHRGATPQEGLAQASEGNNDGGIDAFWLERGKEATTLWIIQAKYSKGYQAVVGGIKDLVRAIPVVDDLIKTGDAGQARENSVIRALRTHLSSLQPEEKAALRFKFTLIHVHDRDDENWRGNPAITSAEDDFRRAGRHVQFRDRVELDYSWGPERLAKTKVEPPQPKEEKVRFVGIPATFSDGCCYFGLGHLADFVRLYDRFRTSLFARNVRMYLFDKAKRQQGPAHQIRESLDRICRGSQVPEQFAVMHNGLTVWAEAAKPEPDDGLVLDVGLGGIYVVNGCQTVYTAWKFFEDKVKDSPAAIDLWERIQIPVRVLATTVESLATEVTKSTNRQNQMPLHAFYAHDPIQVRLALELGRLGIFYERQDGAFTHKQRAEPARMAAEYPQCEVPITMVDLAQAIAAASPACPLAWGAHPEKIFEREEDYRKVFSDAHLTSVRFLVFLVNLLRATKRSLREMRENAGENNPLSSVSASGALPGAFRLLVHYLVHQRDAEEQRVQFCATFAPKRKAFRDFREWTGRQLSFHNSGIDNLLKKYWYSQREARWDGYLEKDRVQRALQAYAWGRKPVFGSVAKWVPEDEAVEV